MAKIPKNQPKLIITPTPKPENNQGDSRVGSNNPNSGKGAETGETQSIQRGALLVQGFQADSDMRRQKVLSPVEQAFEPVDQEVIRRNQKLSDPETLQEQRFKSSENRYSMNMVINGTNDLELDTGETTLIEKQVQALTEDLPETTPHSVVRFEGAGHSVIHKSHIVPRMNTINIFLQNQRLDSTEIVIPKPPHNDQELGTLFDLELMR